MVAKGENIVLRAAETLRREGFETSTSVVVGDAAPAIVEQAANGGADLVIVGTHGRRGIDRLVLGSVAEVVVRQARCPVQTVCRPAGQDDRVDAAN
jgi:nucleotide-binding universal stress UspA family protein